MSREGSHFQETYLRRDLVGASAHRCRPAGPPETTSPRHSGHCIEPTGHYLTVKCFRDLQYRAQHHKVASQRGAQLGGRPGSQQLGRTDRQTRRQAHRPTDTQTTGSQTDRQTDRQTGRQADRQTYRQTDGQTGRQASRQTSRQACAQTPTQTRSQTGRQSRQRICKAVSVGSCAGGGGDGARPTKSPSAVPGAEHRRVGGAVCRSCCEDALHGLTVRFLVRGRAGAAADC